MTKNQEVYTDKKEIDEQMDKMEAEKKKSLSASEIRSIIQREVGGLFDSIQSEDDLIELLTTPFIKEGDEVIQYGVKMGLVSLIGEVVSERVEGLVALTMRQSRNNLNANKKGFRGFKQ